MKERTKNLAIELFEIKVIIPSTSGGCHEIEIDPENQRSEQPDRLPNPDASLASYIDHTILKPDATEAEIIQLCEEANKYQFASVCVNPINVPIVKKHLKGPAVCSVVGFPLGASTTSVKLLETEKAIDDGATEIDMVINIGKLKDKKYKAVLEDIRWIVETCQENKVLLKVIIETCLLTEEEKIIACLLAKKAGAEFVKTSTGFSSAGATVEDIKLMRDVVGPKLGVKASGGVRTKEDAEAMIAAGASRIGASKSLAIIGVQ